MVDSHSDRCGNLLLSEVNMNYTLGAESTQEQANAPLFVRLFNPSEFDLAAQNIAKRIKSYYPGVDLLNLKLWSMLGFDPQRGPVGEFLDNYIIVSRERQQSVTFVDMQEWVSYFESRFGTKREYLENYFKALLELANAGEIPDVIYRPYQYEFKAPEPGDNILPAVKPVINKLIIGAVIVGVAYVTAPSILKAFSTRRRDGWPSVSTS